MGIFVLIIWLHFLADFVLQWDKMAFNKSYSFRWLALHGLVYSAPFIIFEWQFWLLALVSHTLVDGVTSRIAKYFHQREMRHEFFVTLGANQAIHMTCLYIGMGLFLL